MPKINHEEYEVLKELDDKWKWIARDKDGTLVMGAGKNERYLDGWFPPENIGDSLVADEINAVKVISEWGNLFQFIQWEDDEPYNIQELIEEYLYDNQPKLFIDGQEQSFEFIEESEEKEVKKLKSVITEFNQESQVVNSWEGSFTGGYLSSIGFAEVEISSESPLDRGRYLGKEVTIIVGDDEPEVLSQEFIDKYKVDYDNWMPAVPIVHLQNLLVPKQEVTIGKEDAENIVQYKEMGWTLSHLINDYGEDARHDELLAKAWLAYPNIEVEKEQKYYALIKGHKNIYSGICFWIYDTEIEELLIDNAEIYPDVTARYMIKATKDEWANLGITDDNADFVKVEEMEE